MEVIISRRRSKSDVTFYIVMYQKNVEVDYALDLPPAQEAFVEAVSGEKVKFFFNADVNLTSVVNLGYGEKKVQ